MSNDVKGLPSEMFFLLKFFRSSYVVLLAFRYHTVIHRVVQHVRYNYQQIIKRESPSYWLDLGTMSPQKGQSASTKG